MIRRLITLYISYCRGVVKRALGIIGLGSL